MKIQNVLLLLISVPALSCTTWQVQSDPVPNALARLATQRVQVVVVGQGPVELEQATIAEGRVTGLRAGMTAEYSVAIDSVLSVRARQPGMSQGARNILTYVILPAAAFAVVVGLGGV